MSTYAHTQLERDWRAAVEFIASEPGGIERSLRLHRSDDRHHPRCVECRVSGGPWPCLVSRLTQAAIERLESVPAQRAATP